MVVFYMKDFSNLLRTKFQDHSSGFHFWNRNHKVSNPKFHWLSINKFQWISFSYVHNHKKVQFRQKGTKSTDVRFFRKFKESNCFLCSLLLGRWENSIREMKVTFCGTPIVYIRASCPRSFFTHPVCTSSIHPIMYFNSLYRISYVLRFLL